jgi:hypothetical protein
MDRTVSTQVHLGGVEYGPNQIAYFSTYGGEVLLRCGSVPYRSSLANGRDLGEHRTRDGSRLFRPLGFPRLLFYLKQ